VITDLDNDGNMDILMFTSRTDLKLLTVSSSRNIYKPPEDQHTLSDEVRREMLQLGSEILDIRSLQMEGVGSMKTCILVDS